MVAIELKWLEHGLGLALPRQESPDAAGMDVRAAVPDADPQIIGAGGWAAIPTGLSVAIPQGYEIQVRPRSGLAFKHGVTVLNTPGTIDADYRGEIKVLLINHGHNDFTVNRGDRIAQLVVAPVLAAKFVAVGELDATARGEGGFGSTGTGNDT